LNLFGLEIKFRRKRDIDTVKSNRLLGALLGNWSYGRELPSETDFTSQLHSYKSWVYTASNLNATSVAQVPLRLYVAKPKKNLKSRFLTGEVHSETKKYLMSTNSICKLPQVRKAVEIEEVLEHPLIDLLKNVNSFSNGFDLHEMTQLHQELTGNAYWLLIENKLGVPEEIWIVPPDRMYPIPDPSKFISGYAYRYGMTKIAFNEQSIIQFKMPNPYSPYYGLSPLVAVAEAYGINVNMNKYEASIFRNMGRLTGAFETDESLDEQEYERLKLELRETFTGVDNIGKSPLLEKGVSFKDYGLKPAELSFLEGRLRIKEEILNSFGQNLALYDKSATRANSDAAQTMYARRAIKPRCFRYQDKLNEKLVPKFDEYLFFAFEDPVPEDILIAQKVREGNLRSGYSAINEERHKGRLPPIEGGNEPLVQMQYLPLSAIMAGKNLKQDGLSSIDGSDNKPSDDKKLIEDKK